MIKILKNIDKRLLIVSIILFSFGLVMVYSSSNVTAYMLNDASPSRYFLKQALFILTGVLISLILLRFNTKTYGIISLLGTIGMAIAILGLVIYGTATRGAQNWIGYKGLGIQPSEFSKIFIIPLLATYYDANKKYKDDAKKMYFPLFLVAIITVLIIAQSDYGTALIFLIISIIMFFLSPTSKRLKKYLFLLGLTGIIALTIGIITLGNKLIPQEKLDRFNISNPCARYTTTGGQLCNGYIAINGGGLTGKGLGNSTQKYLYLADSHTDFIFAIIIEELGIIGGITLFTLYGYLLLRIIVIGKKSYKISHSLICYGVAIYLFIHIFVNIGGVLGLIPLTGIPLAFMSYGGSYCWSTIIALTFVQRVSYETNRRKQSLKQA